MQTGCTGTPQNNYHDNARKYNPHKNKTHEQNLGISRNKDYKNNR